jgi:hypothetical protein
MTMRWTMSSSAMADPPRGRPGGGHARPARQHHGRRQPRDRIAAGANAGNPARHRLDIGEPHFPARQISIDDRHIMVAARRFMSTRPGAGSFVSLSISMASPFNARLRSTSAVAVRSATRRTRTASAGMPCRKSGPGDLRSIHGHVCRGRSGHRADGLTATGQRPQIVTASGL